MEQFKRLDDLTLPDSRWTAWVLVDATTGAARPYTISDYYATIAEIEVVVRAPDDIREHFQTAKHLMMYAWYVYRFGVVAEMHAYASLEYALRTRFDLAGTSKPSSLRRLLRRAIEEGLLTDANFPSYQRKTVPAIVTGNDVLDANLAARLERNETQSRVALLEHAIPELRNMFAHGSFTLWRGSPDVLRVVAEAINQLF